jgi:hypothetical protein
VQSLGVIPFPSPSAADVETHSEVDDWRVGGDVFLEARIPLPAIAESSCQSKHQVGWRTIDLPVLERAKYRRLGLELYDPRDAANQISFERERHKMTAGV